MIPVIDLSRFSSSSSSFSSASAAEEDERRKLVEACQAWGCFRVVNHGVPLELLLAMKASVRSLFDRPLDVKRHNTDVIPGSGYVAPSAINPLYEAFGLYDAGDRSAVDDFCDRLLATPEQREVMRLYSEKLHELAVSLAGKMAGSFGLSSNLFDGWPTQFRINKYAFTEETVGSQGVCIHTDSSFLTVLQEDDCIGGLEVMDQNGNFVPVDPVPGSFVINLGDIAKVWSNGRFCNLKHRVQCTSALTRISIALFLLGPKKEKILPPPELVDLDHPRLFQPFTYEDYRKLRLSSGLRTGEALNLYSMQQTSAVS